MTAKFIVDEGKEGKYYVLECPHCGLSIQVMNSELACKIFRHGSFNNNEENKRLGRIGQQIPPHSIKTVCDELAEKGLIDGCGKPFKFDPPNDPTICDYL